MTREKAAKGLDFEALRHGIERCDPELVLSFYADDAELSIVNADAPQYPPFELRGKAEIAKHLRAVFGQEASHRVEREIVGEERMTFQEACEYPDGGRMWVETALEVRDGKIVQQVDVVSAGTRPDHEEELDQSSPIRKVHPERHLGTDAPPPDSLLRSRQATEKEERAW
jgi:hypothetical protein